MNINESNIVDIADTAFRAAASLPAKNKTNKKEEKIKRLWNNGTKDYAILAKRLGYSGNSLTAGIERVKEIISNQKLK